MIFDSINIEKELSKVQSPKKSLLDDVSSIFENAIEKENKILIRLKNEMRNRIDFDENMLDTNNIYDIETIEKICINYRLRFLDSSNFKSQYPFEAIMKIKELEKKIGTEIQHFKILAPHEVFELKEINADPLLFAQLSDNRFYLIHKWGNDLAWYRAIINFPFRGIGTFMISMFAIAFLFQMCIPYSWVAMDAADEFNFRLWFTIHCFIGLFSFSIFLGSFTFKGFSSSVWKSKYDVVK